MERDLAHEADMREYQREQLAMEDFTDEELAREKADWEYYDYDD